MDGGRRPLRVGIVMHIWWIGHGAILVLVRSLRVETLGIGIHITVVVDRTDVLMLMLVLVLLMRLVIWVMVVWILRWSSSPTARSHINLSSCHNSSPPSSADTSRHGLPSRQMTTVHLAGLGMMKQWLSTASATVLVANRQIATFC